MLVLILALLAGCRGSPSAAADPTSPPVTATPTPELDTPEAAAAAFLGAMERGDYETVYSLLAPASQEATSSEGIAARCGAALDAATVLTVTLAPQAVLQEGQEAQAAYRLTWDTALVGQIVTDTVMSLTSLGGRWRVEWSGDLIWPGMGEGNYLYMEHYTPARANIYDRNGLALASEGVIVTVGVIPEQIRSEEEVLAALALVTGLSADEIRQRYAGRPAEWWMPIADVSGEVGVAHSELLLNTPGIEAREREGRTYWGGGVASHVVGWVSPVPAEELEDYRVQGYRGDEWVGVAGLEEWGEQFLAGRHGGTLYLMSPAGEALSVVASREAIPGRPVYTTFDREFQHQVQEILGPRRGAIVVLDVHTGAVRALASGPPFDANVFVGPASGPERSAILSDLGRPLFNRATQGAYACGSVFKIVTAAAALEEGGMTPETSFWCPGYWEGLGPSYRLTCWREHGNIILRDALTASCDVTFYAIGQALGDLDPDILPTFGRAFGLGSLTGLEGVAEVAGLVPDPAWRLAAVGEPWRPGDSVNLAIGQGDLLVTPLQVARMMAAVANGGALYRPYIVDRIGAAGEDHPGAEFEPEEVGTLPVSPQNLAVIQEALLGVTTSPIGTATHRFYGMSIPVAGKTGTAQAPGEDSLPHSWFAAYAPADAPEIAVVVMVENAGQGAEVAAPMVRQVVEAFYGLPLTPLPPEAILPLTPTPSPGP